MAFLIPKGCRVITTHLQAQKSKALRAVTKRGQPVMAGRMELLLAKIQEQCS